MAERKSECEEVVFCFAFFVDIVFKSALWIEMGEYQLNYGILELVLLPQSLIVKKKPAPLLVSKISSYEVILEIL